jgi:hypothetical protein
MARANARTRRAVHPAVRAHPAAAPAAARRATAATPVTPAWLAPHPWSQSSATFIGLVPEARSSRPSTARPARSRAKSCSPVPKSIWTTTLGAAQLWTLQSNLAPVTTATFMHDPPGGYFASAYRRLLNGTGRLVWHDNATSNTYVWPLSEQGEFLEEVLSYEPTPDGDWLPVHYTTMPDGRGLLLWVGVETGIGPTGESQAWVMPDDSQPTSFLRIQHTKEQWSRSLTQDPDGSVRIGLGSKADGAGVVCGLAEIAAGVVTVPTAVGWGPGKCKQYSRAGMQFRGYVARWQPSIGDP